jgi:hypothetical protein
VRGQGLLGGRGRGQLGGQAKEGRQKRGHRKSSDPSSYHSRERQGLQSPILPKRQSILGFMSFKSPHSQTKRMSEKVTSAIMYCQENRELLYKYYMEIAKERMHLNDYHLIEHHKALLPTFKNDRDKDNKSKIDAGVDVDKEE